MSETIMILQSADARGNSMWERLQARAIPPGKHALYKIRNIKTPNPKMIPTDWVFYFKVGFISKILFFLIYVILFIFSSYKVVIIQIYIKREGRINMKLALKELTYYKFKYLIVTLILFLLAFLVLFISALAQGLAKENVSGVEQWNKSEYVIASDADNNLSQSNITKQTNQDVNNVAKGDTIKTAMQKVETDSGKADLMFTQLTKDIQPKPSEGHLPKSNHEVLLNEKLKAEGFNVGDDIKLADEDQTFKISGFADNIMFSHTSMAYVNEDGMKDLKGNHISVIAYDNLNDNQKDEINKLDDVKVISQDDMLNAIPSYNAEQQPLNLMIVFLFVISAIVITAFFYVMTIQKTSQFGILKAIGTKNKALIASLMLQILMITLIGVALAIAIIFILGGVMPVSMPFYLDTNLMLLMVAVFIVVSLIGAVLSLIKVMKIEPLEAIGGE